MEEMKDEQETCRQNGQFDMDDSGHIQHPAGNEHGRMRFGYHIIKPDVPTSRQRSHAIQ